MDTSFSSAVASWWAQPFNSKGSALNWVLFFGLVIIGAFLWNTVLIIALKEA